MAYYPIENHGVIGDMHTVALVCMDGSIDWFCYPHFDSPSVFASILDEKKGGVFRLSATLPGTKYKQLYWPDTNVLISRFLSSEGVAEVIDFMPVPVVADESEHPHELVRFVRTVRGSVCFRMECRPAFNYARDEHLVAVHGRRAVFSSETLTLALVSSVPQKADGNGSVAEFTLGPGESAGFVLRRAEGCPEEISRERIQGLLDETIAYWQRWLAHSSYAGRWRETVHRSALVLKLLTFKPTGAIVAAPTCSLPEQIGGSRNWDYRYTWIRDAAFTLYALMRIGFADEAAEFMKWVEERSHETNPDGSLQIMYGIDGRHDLSEAELPHLAGYRNSAPVRLGNDAHRQFQMDIYGELIDTVYLFNKYGSPISYDMWEHVSRLADYVCEHWHEPDEGIWEFRAGRRRFVYSMVMCWVALDRSLRLAAKRSFPADHQRWTTVRDRIYKSIMVDGWSRERQAFVQHFGSETLDASNLIMPLVFFTSPTDPRLLQTIDAIDRPYDEGGLVSDSLVYRYSTSKGLDSLHGGEGTFNICTFWLVEALTRAGRFDRERLTHARLLFEKMLGYGNHLGLYGEQIGPSGEALGNFPQAFTHLSLISAAFNLDRWLG